MSSRFLPRRPAFDALRPAAPEYVPARPGIAAKITRLAGPGTTLRMKSAAAPPAGYYVHHGKKAAATFLKIVPSDHVSRQTEADRLAHTIAQLGVRTITPLPGYPRNFGAGFSAFAYPYVPSRFAGTTSEDMRRIGRAIAVLHHALAMLPAWSRIQHDSRDRVEVLSRRRKLIFEAAAPAGPHPALLQRLFIEEQGLFSMLDDESHSQPIHGDLVYANILFPLDGSDPIIIDFEDALFSWLPRDLDVALALERFALVAVPDDAAATLGRDLLEAYAECHGSAPACLSYPIGNSLRLLSLRALTTLAEMEATGSVVTTEEWEKFFGLYDLARTNELLLARISEGFLA
jgi:hypothetical protein